ncbi:RNA-dependent RNA polymerase 1 [Paramyrothecium foliicola]|nr:RNA-dependent RNA polymerase 1 [Paramyrothecium foliicola]
MSSKNPSPSNSRSSPDDLPETEPNSPSSRQWPAENGTSTNASNWRSWQDLQITVRNLPRDVTAADLGEWFAREGNITWINIHGAPERSSKTKASIRFEPPPKRALWDFSYYLIHHPNLQLYPRGLRVYIALAPHKPSEWVISPVSADRRYPRRMKFPLSTLQFGSMTSSNSMVLMRDLADSTGPAPGDISLKVDLGVKLLTVFFHMQVNVGGQKTTCRFKLEAQLGDLKRAYITSFEKADWALTIPLPFPPQYYWMPPSPVRAHLSEDTWEERRAWHRISDTCEDRNMQLKYPIALFNKVHDPGYMELGRWTTIRLVMKDNIKSADFDFKQELVMALEDFNVVIRTRDDLELITLGDEGTWMHPEHASVNNNNEALALLGNESPQLAFEVRYQLEVCISQGLLNEYSITSGFLAALAALEPMKARLRLEYLADQNTPLIDPMNLLKNEEAEFYFPSHRVPHYCALVRKVSITPTTMHLSTPTVETSNRILRRYNDVQDRFLRVQFLNEKQNDLLSHHHDGFDNYENVWVRVLRAIFQGIVIGDRRYEFLAYGSSQMRQCGAYFFSPTDHLSCDDIRKWMGSFDHIRIPAKYAARVGQCFSTTRRVRGVPTPDVHLIHDTERNGYCFTDGVGIVSSLLAKMMTNEMDLDLQVDPTVFQFRMGGYKGLLAVWPHVKGLQVHARKSQQKFHSSYNNLEVIRCAKYATATLNQQTIPILESLGVPCEVFVKLAEEQLQAHTSALTDNRIAADLLVKFVDENQTTIILAHLLGAGFRSEEIQDPFVVNMVNLWHAWSLRLLKEKTRLPVEKSAFVFGCVDETGSLRGHSKETEGSKIKDEDKLPQIFLQITDPKRDNKTTIIKGLCIIGRNPSLHPGDIRVVQAVDKPGLHHLKDVVVFPSTGDRPVPNMLSGGDLDGDDFFVIWDPELLPKEWNHPPMNYAGAKPVELDRDVTVDDIRNFFVQYMKKDRLGPIAHAHKGHADRSGPKSKMCLELAELHSNAVDFNKSGNPAMYDREKYEPRAWPHFMQKRNTYRSTKSLGAVYDTIAQQTVQFSPEWEHAFDQRVITRYSLSDEALATARDIKRQYDGSVRRILTQQNLTTDFELWSTFAMTRPTGASEYKRQEDLSHEYDILKQRFKEMCWEAAGGKEDEQLHPFVAAMYKVTEDEYKLALAERRRELAEGVGGEATTMPLITFPWLFPWDLIRIAMGDKFTTMKAVLAGVRGRR